MVASPVVLVLAQPALPLAKRIAAQLPGAEVHGLASRVSGSHEQFTDTIAHLRFLHVRGRPVIGICAAGILIRALAPVLAEKMTDPPVLAVSENGAHVVPLLGGHRGANEMARAIAGITGGMAAVTTASDTSFGVALDEPPEGWTLANPGDHKAFAAALLAGSSIRLEGEADWIAGSGLPLAQDGRLTITVAAQPIAGGSEQLVYHPRRLVLGAGCERGCDPQELIDLCEEVLERHGLAKAALALVASLDIKADEPAMSALAEHLGIPLRLFDLGALAEQEGRLANPSDIVKAEVGVAGVAEAAALAAVGADGELLVEKTKSSRATIAIAAGPRIVVPARTGRARGRLAVIGIGPGAEDWRSAEAGRLLRQSTDWVGYSAYLEMAQDLDHGKILHAYGLGEEESRVRHALELAGEGRSVALLCSGDPGIYALATLVFELTDPTSGAEPVSDAAARAEIIVAPGISALQAAAARTGAPLGHDFCAVSLSDLLTPWEAIAQRLKAAADGDFVVALYNPQSQRRRNQLPRALDILRAGRPAETPVVLAREVGRPDESITVTELGALDPGIVDMRTLLLVGASNTKMFTTPAGAARVYTPRGYDRRRVKAAPLENAT